MEAHYEPQTLPELFQDTKRKRYAEIERVENLSKARPSKRTLVNKNIPECIKFILEAHPKTEESTFNKLILNLVTGFQKAGYEHQEALEIAGPFLEGYAASTAYTSPKARVGHFNKEWAYIKKNQNYAFDCSYILGLKFSGKSFQCNRCAWKKGQEKTPEEISSKDILEALGRNEDGDASLFVRLYRHRFRYDHAEREFYVFKGNAFERDNLNEVTQAVDGVVELYQKEADRQNWNIQKAERATKAINTYLPVTFSPMILLLK